MSIIVTGKREEYTTRKVCLCGIEIRVHYILNDPVSGDEISMLDNEQGRLSAALCSRRGRNRWPNSVICLGCGRRHRLERFKREPGLPSPEYVPSL